MLPSSEEVRAVFENASLAMVLTRNRCIMRCNRAFAQLFGRSSCHEMVGQSASILFDSLDAYERFGRVVSPVLGCGQVFRGEQMFARADKARLQCVVSASAVNPLDPDSGTIWVLDDVTTERSQLQALHAVTSLNRAVLASASIPIIATNHQGVISLFNTAAEHLLGYAAHELVGKHSPACFHLPEEVEAYARELSAEFWEHIPPGFRVFRARVDRVGKDEREWTYVRKDSSKVPVWLCITPLRDEVEQTVGYIGVVTDMTEQHKAREVLRNAHEELELRVQQRTLELAQSHARLEAEMAERVKVEAMMRDMAHYDAITGLPNRNLLHDRLGQVLLQTQRNREQMAVMFLDLDRFKNINDTLGHAVGDELLRHVAQRLSMTLRASDTLARLGGDEFVVVLPRLNNRLQAQTVAEKLIEALQASIVVDGHALHISTSIGICLCPDDGTDMAILLRNADTAMYQAKSSGRNTFRFYTERMNLEADRRYRIESALRTGMSDGELLLYFQPLVDMRSGQVYGAEALVRWQSRLLGMVQPDQFIGVAEETDLIVQLDSWVLRQACQQGALWHRALGRDWLVAVNLSARQFRRTDLVAFVAEVLADTGLPAHLLELEITESTLMHNVDEVIQRLEALVRLGVRLAIDDFGTGYSSLAYLKRFPVQKLKIDQSFVRGLVGDGNDAAIVKTVIALANVLGLDLLAEGVETKAQLTSLQQLGCQCFQGYLFSRPLPATDFAELMELDVNTLISGTLACQPHIDC
jgi:diguanylate cyclase (GGDEF)-like protein/PAS domain S-box-containing protein